MGAGLQQLWAIVLIASVIIMGINHPLIIGLVIVCVFIYYKNPGNLKMKIGNLWKKLTTKKPKNPNRRPRMGEGGPGRGGTTSSGEKKRPRWN